VKWATRQRNDRDYHRTAAAAAAAAAMSSEQWRRP